MNKRISMMLVLFVSSVGFAFADLPIDMSSVGDALTSMIPGAAAHALPVLAALLGIGVMIWVFKIVTFDEDEEFRKKRDRDLDFLHEEQVEHRKWEEWENAYGDPRYYDENGDECT